jgi:hypothetical protein
MMVQGVSESLSVKRWFFTHDIETRKDVVKIVAMAALLTVHGAGVAGTLYVNHRFFDANPLTNLLACTNGGAFVEGMSYLVLSREGRRRVINVQNNWLEEISLGVGELHYLLPNPSSQIFNTVWVAALAGQMATRTLYSTFARTQIYETGDDLLYPVRAGTRHQHPLPMLEGPPDSVCCFLTWKTLQTLIAASCLYAGYQYDIHSLRTAGCLVGGYLVSPFLGRPVEWTSRRLQEQALEQGEEVGCLGGGLQRLTTLAWGVRYPVVSVLLAIGYPASWAFAGVGLGLIQDAERRSFQEMEPRRVVTVPQTFPQPGECRSYFRSLFKVSTFVANFLKTAAIGYMLAFIGYLMYGNRHEPESLVGLSVFTVGLPISWFLSYFVFKRFNREEYKRNNPILNQAYFNLIQFPVAFALAYEILRQMNQIDGALLNSGAATLTKIEIVAGFLLFSMACAANRFRQGAISDQPQREFQPMPGIAVAGICLVWFQMFNQGVSATYRQRR